MPFIDCLIGIHTDFLTNREKYYQWQNDDEVKASFVKNAETIFENISSETFTDKQWQYFICLLANRIQNNVAINLSEMFLAEFHSIKRIFVENFENVLQNEDIRLSDKSELLNRCQSLYKKHIPQTAKIQNYGTRCVDILPEINSFY